MSETSAVTQPARLALGRMRNGRILRMNTGAAKTRDGRKVVFGVPGFPDLAGLISTTVPCSFCGRESEPVGRWVGIETKSDQGKLEPDQISFHQMILRYNGLITVARTVEEAVAAARSWGAVL